MVRKYLGSSKRNPYLGVELLKNRDVPATFTVNTIADAGAGSLRDAIDQANTVNDADTIVFDTSIRSGPVGLTTADPMTIAATNTEKLAGPSALVVRTPVTIQGTGETITRSGGLSRL